MSDNQPDVAKLGGSFPIAIVVSQYNKDITDELRAGAVGRLKWHGFADTDITIVEVPGALEIPVMVKYIARQSKVSAIIALGAVIRGDTSHYDYVCQGVTAGCQQIALEFVLPVILGVLTVENHAQALDRIGGCHGHKGVEAADAAVSMSLVMISSSV